MVAGLRGRGGGAEKAGPGLTQPAAAMGDRAERARFARRGSGRRLADDAGPQQRVSDGGSRHVGGRGGGRKARHPAGAVSRTSFGPVFPVSTPNQARVPPPFLFVFVPAFVLVGGGFSPYSGSGLFPYSGLPRARLIIGRSQVRALAGPLPGPFCREGFRHNYRLQLRGPDQIVR